MKAFQRTQSAFIDHLKNPEQHDFDYGVEDRRLKVYRDLFFNNVKGFLDSGFPVLKSLYTEAQWRALARQFFAEHECRSPYFVDISKEFVEYLSNEYSASDADPAFMTELAHYEWLELAISVRKTAGVTEYWAQGDALTAQTQIALSPLAELVSYQFPVHQIKQDYQPQAPGEPVFLVVYRNSGHEVNFSLVNPVSAHLIQLLIQQPGLSLVELQTSMLEALSQLPAEQVVHGVQQTCEALLVQQIFVPVVA